LFTIDRVAKPVPNAAQTLEDQHFFGTEKYVFQLGDWNTVAGELIYLLFWQQFPILRLFPDSEGKDEKDDYSRLQNPTKTHIILKDFFRVLSHCPIIHWVSQLCNNPRLCVC
jgi:hypothetical protein